MTLALPDHPALFNSPSTEKTVCSHCQLPVPAGLIEPGAEKQFCCHGCQTVYTLIHSCRLDRYYEYRAAEITAVEPAKTTGKAYREYDDPMFLELHAPLDSRETEGTRCSDFYLEGVHCAACVWLVEKLPQILPGVIDARLDLGKSLLRVSWGTGDVTLSKIARTLDSLGYPPHPARAASARQVRTLDGRRQLVRIGVAGACAGNAMLLATALYAGLFSSMDPAYVLTFRYLSMAIGLVAIVWPGAVFFRGAWAALRTRTAHLDLPIALGLGAGAIVGTINTLRNQGDIYFDSLTVLVFLLLVGRFLQYRRQTAADDAIELLFSLTPMSAQRINAGAIEEVPIGVLVPGDIIEVLPGECIAADGAISCGESSADESLLTGEAMPRTIRVGSAVFAGATNLNSPIQVRVSAAGEATRIGRLMRLVTECARQRAPIVLFADRIAGRFLLGVLAIALVTFIFWFARGPGGAAAAVDHAVAILIVACPCALGLATPLAMAVSVGRAARRGILIKGGAMLERLAVPGMLLLDKTGTITAGRLSLVRYAGDESAKPLIAAVEACSGHPIARTLSAAFGASSVVVSDVVQSPHGGITAIANGTHVAIGAPAFISDWRARTHGVQALAGPGKQAQACTPYETAILRELDAALADGLTPVLVARDGQVVAACFVEDQIRPDVSATLWALRARGWSVGILSGDHPQVVARTARQLEIPDAAARGGLLPEDKLRIVQQQMAGGRPVVMVGDGVNDAAALAAATVGIAVHGGAEASLAAAGVYLRTPGLAPILQLTNAATQTMRVIHRSLYASLTYNALAVGLAMAGYINPLMAAILMPISSLTVLSLALATRTFTERKEQTL